MNSPGTILPTIPTKFNNMCAFGEDYLAASVLGGVFRSHLNWLNVAWQNEQQ